MYFKCLSVLYLMHLILWNSRMKPLWLLDAKVRLLNCTVYVSVCIWDNITPMSDWFNQHPIKANYTINVHFHQYFIFLYFSLPVLYIYRKSWIHKSHYHENSCCLSKIISPRHYIENLIKLLKKKWRLLLFIHLGNTGLTIWFILYIKNIKHPLKRDGSDITRTLVFTHDQKITYFQVWEMVSKR